jgi:hypothetical protein
MFDNDDIKELKSVVSEMWDKVYLLILDRRHLIAVRLKGLITKRN